MNEPFHKGKRKYVVTEANGNVVEVIADGWRLAGGVLLFGKKSDPNDPADWEYTSWELVRAFAPGSWVKAKADNA